MTLTTTTPGGPDDLTFGQPPYDFDAEKAVLGGMMTARYVIEECADIVTPGEFYLPKHETIFSAIVNMHWDTDGKRPIDPILVADYLARISPDALAQVGGQAYLNELVASVVVASNSAYYAEIVADRATRRRIIEAGTRIVQMGYTDGGSTDELIGSVQAQSDQIARGAANSDLVTAADTVDEFIEWTYSERTSFSTPWPSLNQYLGLEPGRVYTVAGRPGVGKSITANDLLLWFLTKHNKPAALCTMEMHRNEVLGRLIANMANVDFRKVYLDPRSMSRLEQQHVNEAVTALRTKLPPLFIQDDAEQTVEDMRSFARKCVHRSGKAGLGILAIDYLQLFQPSRGRKFGTRQEEVAHMSRQVKVTAKSLSIPVVDLAQLNRVEGKPKMSNLRESGSIEQDSDIVILLHREEDEATGEPLDDLMMLVAKQRGGPRGGLSLYFDGPHMRFTEHPDTPDGF